MENVVVRDGMAKARWMSTFVSFDLVLCRVNEKFAMCGQGADEVFGGYRKYLTAQDLSAAMQRDLSNLAEDEMPAYRAMAKRHGKSLLAPYLDRKIMAYASKMAGADLFRDGDSKPALRDAAMALGVPKMMALRPKKAMQYGSGVSKAIRHVLKSEGKDLESFISSVRI
jgi:asparagine synthase (glutamine-hydrolysing)